MGSRFAWLAECHGAFRPDEGLVNLPRQVKALIIAAEEWQLHEEAQARGVRINPNESWLGLVGRLAQTGEDVGTINALATFEARKMYREWRRH